MSIIPKNYKGFEIYSKMSQDFESQAIILICVMDRIKYKIIRNIKEHEEGYIPIGGIKFIQGILGRVIKPDYYPTYLKGYLRRSIWETDKWPIGRRVFIKPSDEHKRFNGIITNGGWKGKKRGPYICSDIIKIKNEWRYYILNGEIIYSRWYKGEEEDKVSPNLGIEFDKDLISCLDMGEDYEGNLILIESQSPFSCGWYGSNNYECASKYVKWISYGWEQIERKYKNV